MADHLWTWANPFDDAFLGDPYPAETPPPGLTAQREAGYIRTADTEYWTAVVPSWKPPHSRQAAIVAWVKKNDPTAPGSTWEPDGNGNGAGRGGQSGRGGSGDYGNGAGRG